MTSVPKSINSNTKEVAVDGPLLLRNSACDSRSTSPNRAGSGLGTTTRCGLVVGLVGLIPVRYGIAGCSIRLSPLSARVLNRQFAAGRMMSINTAAHLHVIQGIVKLTSAVATHAICVLSNRERSCDVPVRAPEQEVVKTFADVRHRYSPSVRFCVVQAEYLPSHAGCAARRSLLVKAMASEFLGSDENNWKTLTKSRQN
jgi:hypothetical protein